VAISTQMPVKDKHEFSEVASEDDDSMIPKKVKNTIVWRFLSSMRVVASLFLCGIFFLFLAVFG
jgi:hypothetical protein